MSRHVRHVVLAVAIGCLAIAGALAANVALLGLVDRPHGRVGQAATAARAATRAGERRRLLRSS